MRRRKINPSKALRADLALLDLQRFFSRVLLDKATDCWLWQGHKDKNGYGQISINNKTVWVHRWAYAVFKRPLRDGDEVDHICNTPACSNPAHLRRTSTNTNRSNGGKNGNKVRWGTPPEEDDCPI